MSPRLVGTARLPHSVLLDGLGLVALALAALGFFWRVMLAGDWMPAGGGDLVSFLYPTLEFAARSLRGGTLPLWNPFLWGGAPFAADVQSSLFYPINQIYFWLAPTVTYRSLIGLAVFHVWLAGAGAYLCFRHPVWHHTSRAGEAQQHGVLGLSTILPPLATGLAFMFSDFFVVHFGNVNLIAQAAWFPFIMLFFHRSLAENRPKLAVWAGVFLGLAVTAGHIQPILFIIVVLVLDTLYQVAFRNASGASSVPRVWREPIFSLVLTVVVGLGLGGLVLVPAYEMSYHTLRVEYDYAQASRYSLAPAQLVGLFVPAFFGRDPAVHWGAWDRVEVGYAGVLTLLLALIGLLGYRSRNTLWLGLLGGFSLLMALGGYAVLHGWLYQLLPGLGALRAPARFVFVFDFALAGLAGLGLDTLIHCPAQTRGILRQILRAAPWVIGALVLFAMPLAFYAVITSQDKDAVIFARTSAAANGLAFFVGLLLVSIVLLYLHHRGTLRQGTLGTLAACLLFVDLASLGSNVDVSSADPGRGFEHPAIVEFLKSDADLYRIDTRTNIWHLWQPNTSLLYNIQDVAGLVNPLTLADYDRFLNAIPSRSSALFDFLNAKYLIAAKDVTLDWEKFVPVFDADPSLNVYLNRRSLPRAVVVHRAQIAADHEAALTALLDPDFNPARQVILEQGEALEVQPLDAATIRVDAYQLNAISLTVSTSADGYLVLSEVYYPGWRATVDGQPAPILRANYAFRAVRLGPGQHHVVMTFTPLSWYVGLAISGLTLLALVSCVGWRLARRRCVRV